MSHCHNVGKCCFDLNRLHLSSLCCWWKNKGDKIKVLIFCIQLPVFIRKSWDSHGWKCQHKIWSWNVARGVALASGRCEGYSQYCQNYCIINYCIILFQSRMLYHTGVKWSHLLSEVQSRISCHWYSGTEQSNDVFQWKKITLKNSTYCLALFRECNAQAFKNHYFLTALSVKKNTIIMKSE